MEAFKTQHNYFLLQVHNYVNEEITLTELIKRTWMEGQDLELEIKVLDDMDESEEKIDNVVDYIMQWSDFTN